MPRGRKFRAAAGSFLAPLREQSEITLYDSPKSGQKVARSFMMPKTREELGSISRAMKVWEDHTFGMMGRVPDYTGEGGNRCRHRDPRLPDAGDAADFG